MQIAVKRSGLDNPRELVASIWTLGPICHTTLPLAGIKSPQILLGRSLTPLQPCLAAVVVLVVWRVRSRICHHSLTSSPWLLSCDVDFVGSLFLHDLMCSSSSMSTTEPASHLQARRALNSMVRWVRSCLIKYFLRCSSQLHPLSLQSQISNSRDILLAISVVVCEKECNVLDLAKQGTLYRYVLDV